MPLNFSCRTSRILLFGTPLWVLLLTSTLLLRLGLISLPPQSLIINPDDIRYEEGQGYVLDFDHQPCDGTLGSEISLSEDGVALGPGGSRHQHIRDVGAGAFSHKNERLRFSTTDNSDPRENGRTYAIEIPRNVPALIYWGVYFFLFLSGLLMLGGLYPIARNIIKTEAPRLNLFTNTLRLYPKLIITQLVRLETGKMPLITLSIILLLGSLLVFQNLATGVLSKSFVISPETINSERDLAYIIPIDVEPCDTTGVSRLQLYEDGTKLGPAHSRHQDIRDHGQGRFSHKSQRLRFSSSDNSDPRTNGRSYKVLVPFVAPSAVWIALLLVLASLNYRLILSPPRSLHILILCTFATLAAYTSISRIDDHSLFSDGGQYVRMAYNIFQHNTFSMATESSESVLDESTDRYTIPLNASVEPTNYREPFLPVYLALAMHLSPGFSKETRLKDLTEGDGLVRLKYSQTVLFVIIVVITIMLTYRITGNGIASYLAGSLVCFGNSLSRYTNNTSTEVLSALLLLVSAGLLYNLLKDRKAYWHPLFGLSLGLLVLTRGVYAYFIVFALGLILLSSLLSHKKKQGNIFVTVLSLLLVYSIVVGGWSIRNFVHFDSFALTQRGGVVLMARANYNQMTAEEYFGSFFAWSQYGPQINERLSKWAGVTRDDLQPGGKLYRLNRSNPDGYRMQARLKRNALREEFRAKGSDNSSLEADLKLTKLAKEKIKSSPIRHILATLPFAWRGHFSDRAIDIPGVLSTRSFPYLTSTLCWLAMFVLFFAAIIRRNWPIVGLLLLPLYSFGIYSFMTHSMIRYNFPVIPMLAVSGGYCTWWIGRQLSLIARKAIGPSG